MRSKRTLSWLLVLTFLVAPSLLLSASAAQAADQMVLQLRSMIVNMEKGRSEVLNINIERWSDPSELDRLKAVLVEQGEQKLLSALQSIEPRAGFLKMPSSMGWDIKFASQTDLPDGTKKIVIITDRPLAMFEGRSAGDSKEYAFTLAEIHLDKNGGKKGEGKMVPGAKITYNAATKTIEIANYSREPVRLTKVEVVGPKAKK